MFYEKNKVGFKVESGPAAVAAWGIKRTAYYEAFNHLVEYGYLEEVSKNYYIFHERPKFECIVEIANKEEQTF